MVPSNLAYKSLILLVILFYGLATRKPKQSLNERMKNFSVKDWGIMIVLMGISYALMSLLAG